jgi:hypothetical protein
VFSAISQQDNIRTEPEQIRIWREEQQQRLEQKGDYYFSIEHLFQGIKYFLITSLFTGSTFFLLKFDHYS